MSHQNREQRTVPCSHAITVLEFVGTINEIEEEKNMGVIRELFDAKDKIEIQEEQLKSKDEQLQSKDEQLQLKDEQLQSKDEEIKELKKEVNKFKERFEQLEKKLGGFAML